MEPFKPNLFFQSVLRNAGPGGNKIRVQMHMATLNGMRALSCSSVAALGHGVHGADEFIAVGSFL